MHLQEKKLIEAAKKYGIQVTDLNPFGELNTLAFEYQGIEEWFYQGAPITQMTYQTRLMCSNKQLTKRLLKKLNLPHPQSIVFQDFNKDTQLINRFWSNGRSYVCKPLNGSEGYDVEMNIDTKEKLKAVWERHKKHYSSFLLEEQIEGSDIRMHIIRGKAAAVCVRKPAYVMGNGVDSLASLIDARRAVINTQNPANHLRLDEASWELLEKQQLTLESVPADGQKVTLKYIANMTHGGIAVDITHELHPSYQQWVTQLSTHLNVSIFGLDLISKDYTKAPTETDTVVLEINAYPDWLHHTFSEVRQHDIPTMLLKALFPISDKIPA
ncbi:MAG: ATP-grasp domain-containing protein [Flammeovirgaceae bacterium]